MSAVMEFISVTLMPPVLTNLVLTAAPAKKDIPEMDDIVTLPLPQNNKSLSTNYGFLSILLLIT